MVCWGVCACWPTDCTPLSYSTTLHTCTPKGSGSTSGGPGGPGSRSSTRRPTPSTSTHRYASDLSSFDWGCSCCKYEPKHIYTHIDTHSHTRAQGNPHNPALAALIQALPAFPDLEALALEYRNVRCEDCLALAAAIAAGRACGRLKSLNVSYNFLRKEGGRALGACLRQLHDLRELVLNDNSIYYEGASVHVCV